MRTGESELRRASFLFFVMIEMNAKHMQIRVCILLVVAILSRHRTDKKKQSVTGL